MDVKFNCPFCKQSIEAPDSMSGQLTECPNCQETIEIPYPNTASATQRPRNTIPPPRRNVPRGNIPPIPTIPPQKSLGMAIGLNLLLFGCGYFYLGLTGGGLACLFVDLLFLIGAVGIGPVALGFGLFVQVIGAIDLMTRFNKLNAEREQKMAEARALRERLDSKVCPYCGERIKKSAVVCRFCHSNL